jgi:release factor glutamine methyltransferase
MTVDAKVELTGETVAALLDEITTLLQQHGRADARACAEWLTACTLGGGRLDAYATPDKPVSAEVRRKLATQAARLAMHEPLAYVTGTVSFRNIELQVDPHVLIPRPETERLVESVLQCEPLWADNRKPDIADIGTGSGCIVLSLADERPQGRYYGVDASAKALETARFNGRNLGLDRHINWIEGHLLDTFEDSSLDAVVSNPPYIARDTIDNLPASVRDFEPIEALDGGSDGLEVYRELIPAAARKVRPGGHLFLEIGAGQGLQVKALMQTSGWSMINVLKDFADHDRVVYGEHR